VQRRIYDLRTEEDRAEVIVCCEVMEHLYDPQRALEILAGLDGRRYIFSVPREPMWIPGDSIRISSS
jgi:hypothetical protein